MEFKKRPQSSVPAAQLTRPASQTVKPTVPVQRLSIQRMAVQRELQQHTSRPVSVQRQVVQPALRAADLHTQESKRLAVQRQALQREAAEVGPISPEAITQAIQRQQQEAPQVPIKPQSVGDWVTVMRFQAEQAQGRRMQPREAMQYTALQRQVANTIAQGFRQDRQPASARYEQYADHLATLQRSAAAPVATAAVQRMPAGERPAIQRAMDESVQRKAEQQAKDAQALKLHSIQRQLDELESEATRPVLERIQQRRGNGNPLPEAVQRHLEQGLNHDLSAVRIHDDQEADKLAKKVNAVAFTTGQDIYFRSGKFNPNSQSGLELLAHEVTHTVQQARGEVGAGLDPSSSKEGEARQMGRKLSTMKAGGKKVNAKKGVQRAPQTTAMQRQTASTAKSQQGPGQYVANFKAKLKQAALKTLAQNEKRLLTRKKNLSNTNPSNTAWGALHDASQVNAHIEGAWQALSQQLGKQLTAMTGVPVPTSLGKFPIRLSDQRDSLIQSAYINWSRTHPAPAGASTPQSTQKYQAQFQQAVSPILALLNSLKEVENARDYLRAQYPEMGSLSLKMGAPALAQTKNTAAANTKLGGMLKGEYAKAHEAIARTRALLNKGDLPYRQMEVLVQQVAQQEGIKAGATDPKSKAVSEWLQKQNQTKAWEDIGLSIAALGFTVAMLFMPEFILLPVAAIATGGALTARNYLDAQNQKAVSGSQTIGGKKLTNVSPEAAQLNATLSQVDALLVAGGVAGVAASGLGKVGNVVKGVERIPTPAAGSYRWNTGAVRIGPFKTDVSTPEAKTAFNDLEAHRAKLGLKPFAVDNEKGRSTVAVAEVNGEKFYGINSGNDPASLPLRRQTLGRAKAAELGKNLKDKEHLGHAQAFTHAEGHALMLAEAKFGQLPDKVILYVDRTTCSFCSSENGLQALADLFKIKELIVIDVSGKTWTFKGVF